MKKLIFILLFVLFFLYGDEKIKWWNENWHYRIPLIIDSGMYERNDYLVYITLNFNEILRNNDIKETVVLNSVRLIEINEDMEKEIPYILKPFQQNQYIFIWRMEGKTPSLTTRCYYLYFDTIENGEKVPVIYKEGKEKLEEVFTKILSENLLPNSGFEETDKGIPIGWQKINVQEGIEGDISEISQEDVHSGSYSLHIYKKSKTKSSFKISYGGWKPLIKAKPNKKYKISGWIKGKGDAAKCIQLVFFDKNWEVPKDKKYYVILTTYGTHDWKEVSGVIVSPPETCYAGVSIYLYGGEGEGYFDDLKLIEMEEVEPPSISIGKLEKIFKVGISGENKKFIDNIKFIKVKNETKFKLSEKHYEAKETKIPPQIDGKLEDECWKNAYELSNFLIYKEENSIAHIQTHVKITFTNDTIYVGFICDEPNMEGLKEKCREYDGNVWYDDCVEIWFDVNCTKNRSYHILVNPLGIIYDQKEEEREEQDPFAIKAGEKRRAFYGDKNWNSGSTAKVFKGENFWSVELAVPVKNLGIDNIIKGSIWGLNVGRTRRSGNACDLSSWTGIFCTPISNFGTLKLGESSYIVDKISTGNLSNGENTYSIRIKNLTKEKKSILWKIEAVSDIKSKELIKISLNPEEEKIIELPYKLEGIGKNFYLLIEGIEENTKEKIYYDRIDGSIPELLILNLLKNELYLGKEKQLEADVKINVGNIWFQNTFLELELLNTQNEIILSEKIEKIESPFLKLWLNISSLKEEGEYRIKVKIMDKKNKILASKESPFILIKPPF